MKKRYLALGGAILISGLLVMGAGSYLKYGILKPLGIGQDKNAVELPFLFPQQLLPGGYSVLP